MESVLKSLVEDQLEMLLGIDDLVCNSRDKEHLCTIRAVALCRSMCDDVIKFWCQSRVEHYRHHMQDYHRVCSSCGDPIKMDWRVIPI